MTAMELETKKTEFMTGDEFESRVKERVTKFYQENGLLYDINDENIPSSVRKAKTSVTQPPCRYTAEE
ncbi:MAG: hypothetical protein LBT83_00405 [Tannerella sp.]|nr:hypothetical protein [Tannerella sp.]